MTTVTVAEKIRVVLVKPDLVAGRQFQIPAARAFRQDAFAGFILRHDLPKRRAFRRRIFRVRVIVVKPGAVRKHEVALDFLEAKGAALVDLVISRFVRVL